MCIYLFKPKHNTIFICIDNKKRSPKKKLKRINLYKYDLEHVEQYFACFDMVKYQLSETSQRWMEVKNPRNEIMFHNPTN